MIHTVPTGPDRVSAVGVTRRLQFAVALSVCWDKEFTMVNNLGLKVLLWVYKRTKTTDNRPDLYAHKHTINKIYNLSPAFNTSSITISHNCDRGFSWNILLHFCSLICRHPDAPYRTLAILFKLFTPFMFFKYLVCKEGWINPAVLHYVILWYNSSYIPIHYSF